MSPQVGDIAASLAYQLKKEIAENYFGTRKLLEEEREDLLLQAKRLQKRWKRDVLPSLDKIVQLLMEEEPGRAFGCLIERGDLFQDRKPVREGHGTKPDVMSCSPPFALTVRGKYKKLVLAFYQLAVERGASLAQENNALQKRVHFFNEELAQFQAAFNLLEILAFIKSIEISDDLKGVLGNNSDPLAIKALEEKMNIKSLDLSREGGNILQTLPPLSRIQRSLEKLIDQTFHDHCSEIKKKWREGQFIV
jgi:hypothetical protein